MHVTYMYIFIYIYYVYKFAQPRARMRTNVATCDQRARSIICTYQGARVCDFRPRSGEEAAGLASIIFNVGADGDGIDLPHVQHYMRMGAHMN